MRLVDSIRRRGLHDAARLGANRLTTAAHSLLTTMWLRAIGVRLGGGCRFLGRVIVAGDPRRVSIGDRCVLHDGVSFWTHDSEGGHGRIVLEPGVALGPRVVVNSMAEVRIGAGAGLGLGCYVQDNDHGTRPGVPVLSQPSVAFPVHIGAGVWIGAHTIVLKGVHIGDGSVVGAGSVVVKSLPPDVVAVGNPCGVVKARGAEKRIAA